MTKGQLSSHRKEPIIYVDVTLNKGIKKRIVIYEEDNVVSVVNQFCQEFRLS